MKKLIQLNAEQLQQMDFRNLHTHMQTYNESERIKMKLNEIYKNAILNKS